jgi:hypothetical protein
MSKSVQEDDIAANPAQKPRWQVFLESVGGAALITALVGGVLLELITWTVQRSLEKREFNNAWVKARGDQALSAYRDYNKEQLKVFEELYSDVGRIVAGSEALVAAANWDSSKKATREYVGKIAADFNAAEDEWVKAKPRFTLLLSYYSNGNPKAVSHWQLLSRSVDEYRQCVSNWYEKPASANRFPAELICGVQRSAVESRLGDLGKVLEKSRSYVWQGWDNPDSLRATLHLSND